MAFLKIAGIIVVLLALVVTTAVFVYGQWRTHEREGIVAAVRAASPQADEWFDVRDGVATRQPHGRVRVISVDDGLTLSIDEGGGHLGARGVVYSERNDASPKTFRKNFPEGIAFAQIDTRWWTYESTEE